MKQHWEKLVTKVDAMSLRERGLIFAAAAFVLFMLIKMLLFDSLLTQRKELFNQIQQQQEKMKANQAQMEASLQSRKNNDKSPLRHRLELDKQQIADNEVFLQGLEGRLVAPEKMAELLEQVLKQNGRLRLVDLQTLPVAPLVKSGVAAIAPVSGVVAAPASATVASDNQLFKHGVQITVRGGYLDLLQYLTELEQLPSQMFWGKAEMKVEKYPEVELTLTLYTLSQDKAWLKI